ncbi:MAG: hypothetical protein OSA43_11010, partial [Pirellulales bacterium]|nr:hypothetical protein [Pirellulales bacterium]
ERYGRPQPAACNIDQRRVGGEHLDHQHATGGRESMADCLGQRTFARAAKNFLKNGFSTDGNPRAGRAACVAEQSQ